MCTAAGFPLWDGGQICVTAQDLATIPWTAGELDELELLFDSGTQTSSTGSSPSLVAFAATPTTTFSSFITPATAPAMEIADTTTSFSMPVFTAVADGQALKASSTGTSPSNTSTPGVASDGGHLKRKRDRERNTEAARRYRKRRVDETDDLRARLDAMTKERDSLRLSLVKAETEADLLRKLVNKSKA